MQAGDLLGSYALRREIGDGGIAAVFFADHMPRRTPVVVKLLRAEYAAQPETVALFLSEPRALQVVEHENTLEVTDVVAEGAHRYFVTELLRGRTLAELVKRGALKLPRAMHVARQVATVLAHAHDVDVVHRNLKPANVFLVQRDDTPDFVKLLELGATRMQTQGAKPVAGTLIGTPAYMAPEQLRQSAGDHRVDMYSFGVLLFELVVGRKPFIGDVNEVVRQHLLEPAPRARALVPAVPEVLDALIAQCLQKDPRARPPSMHEVSLSLSALCDKLGPAPAEDDGPPTSIAVPKNSSGYTTVPADAVSAPPAVAMIEDDEPSFESVTGEVAILRRQLGTDGPSPAPSSAPPVPRAAEIDATLRPVQRAARPMWPFVAAGATVVVVFAVVAGLAGSKDVVDEAPQQPPDVVAPAIVDAAGPATTPSAGSDAATPPPPSVPDAQGNHLVSFRSTPSKAQVWIRMDKAVRLLCTTPCAFKLPGGKEVLVELRLDGYRSAQQTITVGAVAEVDGALQRK